MTGNKPFSRSAWLLAVTGLLLTASAASATDLGRLFTTAEERLRIDALRKDADAYRFRNDHTAATASNQLTLNGTLRGSNGRQRVWINGKGLSPTGADAPATLLYDGRVRLLWQGGKTGATLKPGQTVDKSTGDVYEAYAIPAGGTAPVIEE